MISVMAGSMSPSSSLEVGAQGTDTQVMDDISSFWTCIVSGESAGNTAINHCSSAELGSSLLERGRHLSSITVVNYTL